MSRADVSFVAEVDLQAYRFVTINKAAGTINYAAADAAADGITKAFYSAGSRAHIWHKDDATQMFDVKAGATISRGDEVAVGATDGQAKTIATTGTGFFAAESAVAGQVFEVYKG